MFTPPTHDLAAALNCLPEAPCLLTAAFEGKRAGVLVRWVQRCAVEPPLVSVAVRKGHRIEPIIRDSHSFAVCRIDPEDRLVMRKFLLSSVDGCTEPARDESGESLETLGCDTLATGSPILRRCVAAIDCRVLRHIDLESDHELYVGLVVTGRVTPARV